MKTVIKLLFLFLLISCSNKQPETIDLVCKKAFVYYNDGYYSYYYVIQINNNTKNDVKFKKDRINYIINNTNKELYLKIDTLLLTNPIIEIDKKDIWKINPNDSLKMMYYLESDIALNEKRIHFMNSKNTINYLNIPNYIKLTKEMSFDRSIYEVDGTINGVKPDSTDF